MSEILNAKIPLTPGKASHDRIIAYRQTAPARNKMAELMRDAALGGTILHEAGLLKFILAHDEAGIPPLKAVELALEAVKSIPTQADDSPVLNPESSLARKNTADNSEDISVKEEKSPPVAEPSTSSRPVLDKPV